MAIHSLATVTSTFVAIRMTTIGPLWWEGILWYFGSFVGLHVVMVPFMTAWHAAKSHFDRRVRTIVEEELIRFDLQSYQRQLERVFPPKREPPEG
jgi:hypothetical protein